ncbi:MAG TPA: hypothetical protein VK806_06415 [Bacteroidia bacterium]|jgi:hypothetical protein|nr:hypothetical protein [Bacteroidia bacterium]
MKKSVIAIWFVLLGIAAFCQPLPHTGIACANQVIYDSAGVTITVNETQVITPNCSSDKDKKVCIFKCNFSIKNVLSVPVTIASYDFQIDVKNTGYATDATCDPRVYGDVEQYGTNLTVPASSSMVFSVYGETPYDNNPKCCYKWVFSGYSVDSMVGK